MPVSSIAYACLRLEAGVLGLHDCDRPLNVALQTAATHRGVLAVYNCRLTWG